ncbi:MAG: A/G-specific adenine glycosylase, partial [Aquipseudomonas alcaligenes]
MSPEQFNGAVLAGYGQNGRKDLRWQQGVTLYWMWVLE